MSGGVHKVGKDRKQETQQPKIVGANPQRDPGTTKTLDQRSKPSPVEIQTKHHGQIVSTDGSNRKGDPDTVKVEGHVRSRPRRKKSEPDVRLVTMTPNEAQAWDDVKSLKWED